MSDEDRIEVTPDYYPLWVSLLWVLVVIAAALLVLIVVLDVYNRLPRWH